MKNIFVLLSLSVCMLTYGQTGEKNFIDQNYIEVTGKAEMNISPDQIYIKVLISEKDTKNKISVSELEKKMINTLESIGIDIKEDLLVKDMSSNFKFYLLSKNDILLSRQYSILVRDGKTAGKVFIELEKIGISNVSIERLDHSKMVELRNEVKVKAILAAKEKASLLANAICQEAGRAIYIKEMDQQIVYRNKTALSNTISVYKSASQDLEPEIDFEKIKIEYAILCKFELK